MGALHEGHMALIRKAARETDYVVCSVFVNPTQFTNPDDLKLYPRTPEKDTALLSENGCQLAWFPTVDEVYPADYVSPEVPLGTLATVLEGQFRPGHFEGVVQVVSRFFDVIKPDKAFFGLKDFQQVAVIRFMADYLHLPVKIYACPTLRESTGLAMSSRNMRLTEDQKDEALEIYRILSLARELSGSQTPEKVMEICRKEFESTALKLEYFAIVNPNTLETLSDNWVQGANASLAAWCGDVRLIDNLTVV